MYNQTERSEKKDTTTRVDAAEDDEATNLVKRVKEQEWPPNQKNTSIK